MFEFVRTHQRLMQFLLLVLIVPSFALIGVGGYTTYVSGDQDLVKVGKGAITQQDFDQARRNQLQQMQQSNPGGFDPALLDTPEVRKGLLESLIDRSVIINTAAKDRFSVSDTVLRESIASMPQLQVDGRFSPERYNELLDANGLSSRDFEEGRRGELALDRVLTPVAATAKVPAPVMALVEKTLTAERTIRVRAFPASDYAQGLDISEHDIKAWYDGHASQLELPEMVTAKYLLLDEQAAMKSVPAISEDELRSYYEQNKSRYVLPARVNVSHILISVPKGSDAQAKESAQGKAQKIADALKAHPESFAETAARESDDPGTAQDGGKLGWITQGSWPADLEAAVFALKKGEISDPVEGTDGYHVFKADDVQEQSGESFEQARPKVEAEVRRQLAADRYADMATRLTDLVYDNPSSLKPAADALGLQVKEAGGIARDRLVPADEVGPGAASAGPDAGVLGDARVRRALFSPETLNDKQNSGVIELAPDTIVVVRVESVTPAQIPPLERVSDHIREILTAQGAAAAAKRAGEAAMQTYRESGSSADDVAFGEAIKVSRIDPHGVGGAVLDAVFAVDSAKIPEYIGIESPQGYLLVHVESADEGTTDNPMLEGLSAQLDRAWGEAEKEAVLKLLRVQAKVKVLPEAEKALSSDAES